MPRKPAQPNRPAAPQRSDIVVYATGADVRLEVRTVWLSQAQMCKLFGRSQPVIARHIANIFKEGELAKEEVYAKFAYTTRHGAIPGKTQVQAGVNYLVQQLTTPPPDPPRRKIGFTQARR